jgi:dihydrofolate reductase
MGALILQMQMSVDGFVSAAAPGARWQLWGWGGDFAWDRALRETFNQTFERIDTIQLSRPMIEEGFLEHWAGVADRHACDADFAFARKIAAVRKVVVTNTLTASRWPRTEIRGGDFAEAVRSTKAEAQSDVICFGGTRFARSLLRHGLVDELQLYVNPSSLGAGAGLFEDLGLRAWRTLGALAFDCGMIVARYAPQWP